MNCINDIIQENIFVEYSSVFRICDQLPCIKEDYVACIAFKKLKFSFFYILELR